MSWLDSLKHAFAIDHEGERTFTDEERALAGRIAEKIVGRQMTTPALLFLESARPLNFLGSQALAVFEPMVGGLVSGDDYAHLRRLLEKRGSVDLLLDAIEAAEKESAKNR
ncbi:MAG: hypothetical protein H6684_13255 [Deltaproteobacteria bacterium]|nr:hypothetical protein [Deltaproteobacteria bacterium]MCB9489694.1 hypothetical protein [Deltaproteobacteria bacterium]